MPLKGMSAVVNAWQSERHAQKAVKPACAR
jgi:phage terminase large subunit-like protein